MLNTIKFYTFFYFIVIISISIFCGFFLVAIFSIKHFLEGCFLCFALCFVYLLFFVGFGISLIGAMLV